MAELNFSRRFLDFLGTYSQSVGKSPERIVEEAVGQAILRHQSASHPSPHDGSLLIPAGVERHLLSLLPPFDRKSTDTSFGTFMEQLPDRNWTYQIGRLDEWWFLLVADEGLNLPDPLELRSVENSQAYCWIFGHAKLVKLWSGPNRFLIVF
jgi:hypothetical protein